MSETALHRLASRVGLSRDWIDANARPQRVSDEVLRNILEGLGHPANDDAAIAASLRAVDAAEDSEHLPPLLTADLGQPLALARYFSAASVAHCTLEDHSALTLSLDDQARLPGALPIGYHQVEIDSRRFTVAVAPLRCHSLEDRVQQPPPRCWGLAVQLYSLRRPGDGGYGDCLALEQLARAAAERGADALAISPIHALLAIDQTHYSPYSPSSRLLLNTLYASPAALLGEREVRVAIEACGLEQQLEDLEQGPLVDWPRAASADSACSKPCTRASARATTRYARTSTASAKPVARRWNTIAASKCCRRKPWSMAWAPTGATGPRPGTTHTTRKWRPSPTPTRPRSSSMPSANG